MSLVGVRINQIGKSIAIVFGLTRLRVQCGSIFGPIFLFCIVCSNVWAETLKPAPPVNFRLASEVKLWFQDSFEGMAPQGWKRVWHEFGIDRAHLTTDEAGVPPAGGVYSYRQSWPGDRGAGALWLYFADVAGMPNSFNDGDEVVISYYLKYHSSFDFGESSGFKQWILQGDRTWIYHIISGNSMVIAFSETSAGLKYANVGGDYMIPRGEWVHFRWQIKISPEAKKEGMLKGWVNDQLRWDYTNIATVESGGYDRITINYTFNQEITGSDQHRYWDLFAVTSGIKAD